MAVICGKQYGNLCGGIPHTDSLGNLYEVLGPGYTGHHHPALVTAKSIPFHTNISVICIMQILPIRDIEVSAYEFDTNKVKSKSSMAARKVLKCKLENVRDHINEIDLTQLKYRGAVLEYLRDMARDFPSMAYAYASGFKPDITFQIELDELGLPVDYLGGNRIYLNGPGYSTQPDNSIVMYAQQITLDAIVRYEYARGELNVKMFTVRADGGYEKIHDQTMPLAEARRSPASLMLEFLQAAAQEFYGTRAL